MTAIGFVGLLICASWAYLRCTSVVGDAEAWVLVGLFIMSDMLLTSGIAIWLWRVMP